MIEITSKKKYREFGLILGIFIPIIFGYFIPQLKNARFNYGTLYLGISLIIIGLINPLLLKYPYKIWNKFGYILGWINSRIILTLLFFAVLLPISLFMKITGYDPLKRKERKANFSYRENKVGYRVILDRIF